MAWTTIPGRCGVNRLAAEPVEHGGLRLLREEPLDLLNRNPFVPEGPKRTKFAPLQQAFNGADGDVECPRDFAGGENYSAVGE